MNLNGRRARTTAKFLIPALVFTVASLAIAKDDPLRNPFWPVGHRAAPGAAADDPQTEAERSATDATRLEQAWNSAREQIQIQGVSRRGDGLVIAIINGHPVAAGETVHATLGTATFSWRVKAIDMSGVDLERLTVSRTEASSDAGKEEL